MHLEVNTLKINNAEDGGVPTTGGNHPVSRVHKKSNSYWTDFCYYKPATIDCGEIFELDASKPEVTFSSPNAAELECYWLVKAPRGQKLKLDFTDFEVRAKPGKCKDQLEVRYVRPGQLGLVYCGRTWEKTIVSINNTIHMRFSTYGDSNSRFTATVKLVQDSDLCYSTADWGMTYSGGVSFTRDFEPCLPWHEMAHCEMHPFKTDQFITTLQSNRCRNPDQATGFQPWCYTKAQGCIRNYCDVCLVGKRYDLYANCAELKAAGQCSLYGCAKTCADQFSSPSDVVKASQIICSAPGDVPDGTLTETPKPKYAVGESVMYKCESSDQTRQRYCLTTGQWSVMGTACAQCPDSYTYNGNNSQCYYFPKVRFDFDNAEKFCKANGNAMVAFPVSASENSFLKTVANPPIWLGIIRQTKEGSFTTVQGEPATYTNWEDKQPNKYGKNQNCVEMNSKAEWNDNKCTHTTRRFICQKPASPLPNCLDFLENCAELFALRPSSCTDFPKFAEGYCRFTCGLCDAEDAPKCQAEKPGSTSGETIELMRGQTVHYACQADEVQIAGDAVRGCTALGTITGTALECFLPCPSGWTLNSDNLHCYKKFDTAKKYPDAQAHCVSLKGNLATAKDQLEQGLVKDVKLKGNVWLGMDDETTEHTWTWVDGELVSWTFWDKGEPNDAGKHGEDCGIMINNGRWKDVRCSTAQKYICKVPLKAIHEST